MNDAPFLAYRINPEAGDSVGSDFGDVCLCTHEYNLDDQACLPGIKTLSIYILHNICELIHAK